MVEHWTPNREVLGSSEADQCLCLLYMDSCFLNSKFPASIAIFCACTAQFVSDLVGNHVGFLMTLLKMKFSCT